MDGGDASRVAIVAGVHGHRLRSGASIDEHSPLSDAAGVYVVQKDDPQDFLAATSLEWGEELAEPVLLGRLMNPARAIDDLEYDGDIFIEKNSDKAKSHVTAYADTIQLVARNGGVNLYAGGVDRKLSSGPDNREAMGVNLIYGNKVENQYSDSPYSLEPLVKGNSLDKVLSDVAMLSKKVNGVFFELQLQMNILNFVLAVHTHPVMALGAGIAFPSIELLLISLLGSPVNIKNILATVSNEINTAIASFNRSEITTASYKSICNKKK